jgi:hypothetical protein
MERTDSEVGPYKRRRQQEKTSEKTRTLKRLGCGTQGR